MPCHRDPCLTLLPAFLLLCLLPLLPAPASGSPAFPVGSEEILFKEIPSVFTASKYEQKVTEAPSAVSIVTAEEIRDYGYRTLADILRSVRGFYTTYDLQTEYLGVRGFSRPGDFNARILLLIDGIRANNNIFDTAVIGNDFPLDIDLIDRVEIVRGPGSSLYGSNAFFAVVNVITRRGRDLQGAELSASAASNETYRGRLSYGERFPGGLEVLVSASGYDSQGRDSLYFPEFDTPESNFGRAEDVNSEDTYKLFGAVTLRDLTLEALYVDLDRQVPTGAFGTVFNDPRNRNGGRQGFAQLKYQHLFENQLELLARAVYSNFRAEGDYVYDYGAPGEPFLVVNKDTFQGQWWGGEVQVSKLVFDRHRLVAGAEYRDNVRQDLKNSDLEVYLDSRQDTRNTGLFLQDDIQLRDDLTLSAGLRYDHFSTFGGQFSPRLGLNFTPVRKTALKILYGEAFRAPSAFENYYHDGRITQKPNPGLDPETIRTYEVVWEQYLGDHLRGVATGFYYEIDDLINLTLDPADGLLVFDNLDEVETLGVELELEGRLEGGWEGRISYSLQDAENSRTGEDLDNSPRHLLKLNLKLPLWLDKLFLGLEEQYTSSRQTIAGEETGGTAITNLTLYGRPLWPNLELTLSAFNLFDRSYRHPVSAGHRQDAIEQEGRVFRGELTCRF